jgi:phosphoglycerol transferase
MFRCTLSTVRWYPLQRMALARPSRRLLGVSLDRRDALAVLALAVLCATAWLGNYRKLPWELAQPVEYSNDAMFQLGAAKAAADRGLGALWGATNPYLAAPAEARWSDFPASEDAVYLGIGLLSRLVGPNLGMNLAYLGTGILAAWCMYLVARRLRVSRQASMLAGALFAMSPYFYWRNIHHVNLAVYWPLPLVFLVWLWAGSRRGLVVGTRRFRSAVAIAALVAVHNNYYLNYALQVLLLLLVLQAVRGRWRAVLAGVWVMCAAMGVFLLVNADTFIGFWRFGANPEAVQRSLADTVRFGLRPMELFIPSPLHRIPPLDQWGALYRPQGTGEFPSPFLGLIGGVAFVALVLQGLRGALVAEARGMASRFLVCSLWLVALAVPGGLLQLAQTITGFVAFRSNNRVSILLLGMALLFAGRALDRLLVRRGGVARWGACVGLMLFGLWEQSPDVRKLGDIAGVHAQLRAKAESDERLVARLQQELPPGAAVMQWPPMAFPEGGGVGGAPDYDYFRPYLYSRTLRFSYGSMKGRSEASHAYRTFQLPAPQAVAQLKAEGFHAVMFHLAAISGDRAQAWAQAANQVTPTRLVASELGDWLVVAF